MIQRTYYCEGPADNDEGRCPHSATTASAPPYLPRGLIETRCCEDDGEVRRHFCSWDCAMKYAATQPVEEVIE